MTSLRVALIFSAIVANTVFHVPLLLLAALVKAVLPSARARLALNGVLTGLTESWIAFNTWLIDRFSGARFSVTGLEGLQADGHYLVLANHQSWVDIVVLQKVFNRRIPLLRFFLKRQLFWVPLLGLAWWALDFPFMGRHTKAEIAKNPELGRRDMEATRRACEKFRTIPVAIMNFVEGTRFTPAKHARQASPYRHLLKPKAGGVAYVLDAMDDALHGILDVTIAYPGGRPTMVDLMAGRLSAVHVAIRQRPLPTDSAAAPDGDARAARARLQQWVNGVWQEKDEALARLLDANDAPAMIPPPASSGVSQPADFLRTGAIAMKLQLSLEWFLNPDHLPLIAGIDLGWYRDAGLALELLVPDDHYDGLAATVSGEVAFACNEPLHMIDAQRPGLKALGCFFETDGGILLQRAAGQRLLDGGRVRLASPVAGGVTDAIAVEILARWCAQQGAAFDATQVSIESAGFEHLANLRAGFDGAWLCFANFEDVEARLAGLDTHFITTGEVGLHNFSALELFTSAGFLADHPGVVDTVTRLIGEGARLCREDPAQAAAIWYRYSGTQPDALMDAILADTCPRLVAPVRRDAARWHGMWEQFDRLGLSQVDRAGYAALYD